MCLWPPKRTFTHLHFDLPEVCFSVFYPSQKCALFRVHFIHLHFDLPTQDIMMFLQNLPTAEWTNDDIELLLAEAYKLKFMFDDAPGHLNVKKT